MLPFVVDFFLVLKLICGVESTSGVGKVQNCRHLGPKSNTSGVETFVFKTSVVGISTFGAELLALK